MTVRPEGERLAAVEQELRDVRDDIREIKQSQKEQVSALAQISLTLATAKGGWRVLIGVATVAGTIGAVFGQFIHFWKS